MEKSADKVPARHEFKHFINNSDYLSLRQRLRAVTEPDGHVQGDGKYRVRSLYFDNYRDKALMEKINGVNHREKFRIRYYNADTNFIRLEKKSKRSGLCYKQSVPLTREQCERILSGGTEWMRDSGDPLLTELYAKMEYQQLRPRVIVDYDREPFVYGPGNVRITADSNIRTGLYSTDLFSENCPTIRCDNCGAVILEVKYDRYLPDLIRDVLQTGDRRCGAFSKYAASRRFG